jgi:hypothetical protein
MGARRFPPQIIACVTMRRHWLLADGKYRCRDRLTAGDPGVGTAGDVVGPRGGRSSRIEVGLPLGVPALPVAE